VQGYQQFLWLVVCFTEVSKGTPMGTAWTYQGRLMDANDTADGLYDFQFALFDDPVPGVGILQGYIDVNDLDVIDGYFTVELDFNEPNAFTGDRRWLEVALRPGDSNDPKAFVKLRPRHEVTPTPYALYAKSAGLQAPIQVSGSFDFPEAVIEATNTSTSNGYAISGVQSDKGTVGYMGGYYGVYGRHDGNLNYGYLGGSDYGVYGRNINENHGYLGSASYGVYGSSINGTAGYFTSSSGYGLIVESGNVGIGTMNPSKDLEVISKSIGGGIKVYGDASTGSHDSPGFQLGGKDIGGNDRAGDLSLALSDGHFSSNAAKGDLVLRAEDTNIHFSTQSSGGFPAKMTIKSDGNVGIGTANPTEKLEVSLGAGSGNIAGFSALNSNRFLISVDGSDTNLSAQSGNNLKLGTSFSGTSLTVLNSNGNVGIGTANPPTVLALGASVTPIISVASTNGNDSTFLGLAGGGSMSYDRGSSIALHGNEHTNRGTMWFRVGWDPSTMTGDNDGDLIIETAHTERFRIDKEGNVGIGTASPDNKLTVEGTMKATSAGVHSKAIHGVNNGGGGIHYAGYFEATGDYGTAIRGEATGKEGKGLLGYATAVDGIAIRGRHLYASGLAGSFEGNVEITGDVGIGTTSPESKLDIRFPSGAQLAFTDTYLGAGPYVEVKSGVNVYGISMWLSSRAEKKNIVDLQAEVDTARVYDLRPVSYNYKHQKEDNPPKTIGLLAEEVEKVLPQLVMHEKDGKPFSVDYKLLSVLLLQEGKKQRAEIKELKAELDKIKAKLAMQ
jgi:hypothetical protein